MSGAQEKQAQTVTKEEEGSLLDQILSQGRLATDAKDASSVAQAKDLLGEFVSQVLEGQITVSKDLEASINARIAAIDELLSAQMNQILHNPDFQKLEGSWRGLKHLVFESETGTMMKIRVMNASKKDLLKDLEKAPEFDQSALFKKVYEEEYGQFGGAPYAALIGDYEFSNSPQDMTLLEKISQVAAAANAPFISSAAPQLFGRNSYAELSEVRDLAKIFESSEYAKWRSFRESDDSRYVGLTLPRTLMRLPYGPETIPCESFNFDEDVDGTDHSQYCWGNAAYSFGTRLTEAFAMYQWCVTIRGVEGGGLVEGLPTHTFKTDDGDVALKCPTEVAITDRREKEYSDLGFIPLVHCKGTDFAAFFGAQSCNKPAKYNSPDAEANARLSSQLPNIFAVSRFAHYLKVMMRDKIGSFMSRGETEKFLNTWISDFITPDENASAYYKAQKPLRDAKIEVVEVPGKPGAYRAVAHLRPHFQLDELSVSLRMVANLPGGAG